MRHIYPLAAIVGQNSLVDALLVNAIDPGVGGLLIRGEKGTAKSTAARGLAAMLPPIYVIADTPYNLDPDNLAVEGPEYLDIEYEVVERAVPFIELPLGATEDRVLGTLDFERALQEGRRAFQPGLLAAAHRGILYIDEVNLLPDHLVDVLLDAAAMGVNTVQRESVSVSHPARFILIGTMNPEEGDLRPQLLDRFGLTVEVAGPKDPEIRKEVVRRRMAFEDNPEDFQFQFGAQEAAMRERVIEGRRMLHDVAISDDMFDLIARVCIAFDVDGMRADLFMHRAARAVAALQGNRQVELDDIRTAATWVLPHRRRRQPFEQPGLDRAKLDALFEGEVYGEDSDGQATGSEGNNTNPKASGPGQAGLDGQPHELDGGDAGTEVVDPGRMIELGGIQLRPADNAKRQKNGRRNTSTTRERGHYIRARQNDKPTDLALDATLRSAAVNGLTPEGRPIITRADLHQKVRKGKVGTLILFIVDGSSSMSTRQRMEAVKGATMSFLLDAYQKRDRVSVISFNGSDAKLVLPPTNSIELAEKAVREMPTGGRTPLTHALILAREVLEKALRTQPEMLTLYVLLSDCKGNVRVRGGTGGPMSQAHEAAEQLAALEQPGIVLDVRETRRKTIYAEQIAESLRAEYIFSQDLSAENLLLTVNRRLYTRET